MGLFTKDIQSMEDLFLHSFKTSTTLKIKS